MCDKIELPEKAGEGRKAQIPLRPSVRAFRAFREKKILLIFFKFFYFFKKIFLFF